MGIFNLWKKFFGRRKKAVPQNFRRKRLSSSPSKKTSIKVSKKKSPLRKVAKREESRKLKTKPQKEIGVITHYFRKISVGVIKLKSSLKVGDKIHIKGTHDDFIQTVKSMQVNHKNIASAKKGMEVGIKVIKRVHEHDKVYKKEDG